MLNLKEDSIFSASDLDVLANKIIKAKDQRQGAGKTILRLEKILNKDKNVIINKMLESNIITKDNRWSHHINNKISIKIESLDPSKTNILGWKTEDNKAPSFKLNKITSSLSKEDNINNIFLFFKDVFPSKRSLTDLRKNIISKALTDYSPDQIKKAIQSRFFAIEIAKLRNFNSQKAYDDIPNILNANTLEKNINNYDSRFQEYFTLSKKSGKKEVVSTEIFKIMQRFAYGSKKGILELNCPTGTGKTFAAVNFMMDFIRNDSSNRLAFFFAKQKTNLESPKKDLLNSLTEDEKSNVFQFNSNEDLCESINQKSNHFHNLFNTILYNEPHKEAKNIVNNISEKRKNDRLTEKETYELYKEKIKRLRNIVLDNLTEEKYNILNTNEKDALYEMFPLNKIIDGNCKVIFSTIDKALLPSNGIRFLNKKAKGISEKLIALKKNGVARINDIFIIDESQLFVPTVNKRHIDDSVSFDFIDLLRAIGDRFITASYEDNESDLKSQIELIKSNFTDVFTKYKLNNTIKTDYKNETTEEKFSYLINRNESILPLKETDDLYYVIEDENNNNITISKIDISNNENIFKLKDVLHDFKSIIFRFNKIIATSYKMFLNENALNGSNNKEDFNPINKYIIEKKIGHTQLKSYVETIVGLISPRESKKVESICDLYSILNDQIQVVSVNYNIDKSNLLELSLSEGDGNEVLANLAASNHVLLMSGTANSRTVIANCHIEYLKHTLNGKENCDYQTLDLSDEKNIMDEYKKRLPLLESINRNITTYDVKGIRNWEHLLDSKLESVGIHIIHRSYIVQQIKNSSEYNGNDFNYNRLYLFIENVLAFLENPNSQIMLNCLQKFNYDFFSEESKMLSNSKYTLQACIQFIIENSKYKDNNIIIKSYDSEGFRNNLKQKTDTLVFGQKYIIIGTIASIGQGANIKFNIKDKESANKMNYIVVNDNDSIEACIDTLYVESPTYLLGLLTKGQSYQRLLNHIMKANLLLTNNDLNYKKYKEIIIKSKDTNFFNNFYIAKTIDQTNNIAGIIKQIFGRVPRGNAYKKDINIIVENKILGMVSDAYEKNVAYNTFEYIELHNLATREAKPSRRNLMENKKYSNANDAFESKQSEVMNKLNLAKKSYKKDRSYVSFKYLEGIIKYREDFINKVLSSLHNRNDYDVSGAYFKFNKEKYFYSNKSGSLEVSEKAKNGFSSFCYDDLNSDLFCNLTGHDRLHFPHLSDTFDKTIMPVPSLVRYLKGFMSEYYIIYILENCFNAKIIKVPSEIAEDCDLIIEYSGKILLIDVKTSSLDNYNKNKTMETKVTNAKKLYPEGKYVIVDLFESDIYTMIEPETVSRFSGLINPSEKTLNKIEFTKFVDSL